MDKNKSEKDPENSRREIMEGVLSREIESFR